MNPAKALVTSVEAMTKNGANEATAALDAAVASFAESGLLTVCR